MNDMTAGGILDQFSEPVIKARLDALRAMVQGGGGVTDSEARFLVDTFHAQQKMRIRINNQIKQLDRDAEATGAEAEPNQMLKYIYDQQSAVEKNISTAIELSAFMHPMYWFFEQTKGIGPGIAMKLLAHLDIHKAPTVGHFWSFAGMNPEARWEKGKKRPHNADLKRTMFLITDQFIKRKNDPDSHYSRWLFERRDMEWQRNLNGGNTDSCAQALEAKRFGDTTDAKAWYSGQCCPDKARAMLAEGETPTASKCKADGDGLPMLPPAHVVMRARRWTAKLFLAHLHDRWYRFEFGEAPPKPYVIDHKGHAHIIEPPQVMP